MRLSQLAAGVAGASVEAGGGYEVRRVVEDSRHARPGDVFVAVVGLHADGHDFAVAAATRGAAVAVERSLALPPGTAVLRLRDTRSGLAELAAELRGRPARRLLMVGVTGTDGKTTVTHMTAHLLETCGLPAGFLSTVAERAVGGEDPNRSGLSTMGAPALQERLAEMAASGLRAAVVETTSHALTQARVAACDFDAIAVTNVGRDHLDYHGTWQEYLEAKARLIDLCAAAPGKGLPKTAVLNRDDPSYRRLAEHRIERRTSFSLDPAARSSWSALGVTPGETGSTFRLRGPEGAEAGVRLRMAGRFNVANALAAAAVAHALGAFTADRLAAALSSFPGVRGRLEPVDLGQPFRVYVDFAHSASGLASVLGEVRGVTPGRLLAVFGATGRSDHDRPGMGRAAARGSDWFAITTDDPVAEDPAEIASVVEAGVEGRVRGRDYEVLLDRRDAIRRALALARPGDAVVLAGKGHERTMIFGGRSEPWDERAEAEAALRALGFDAPRLS